MIPADDARRDALRLAVDLYARRDCGVSAEKVIAAAAEFAVILHGKAAHLSLDVPAITGQDNPARLLPLRRTGVHMAVTITDTQVATYSVSETDSKGFPVTDPVTWSEDSGGAVVVSDGNGGFTAVAPGTANITATDGTLSASDVITVDPGAAASLVLGTPAVTEQAA